MKIRNPEKECIEVPRTLSGTSNIVGLEKYDDFSGIILDSPEEFANALIIYNGGSVPGAGATQKNLMDSIGNEGGGMGAGLALLAGLYNSDGFNDRLAKAALTGLQSAGKFYKDFDYDGMGTNFFKTTIIGQKVADKYILELRAAYVGSAPEKGLAKLLDKPMALVNSRVKGKLSVVDDWWFNVSVEDAVKSLSLTKEQVEDVCSYIASSGWSSTKPDIIFEHRGSKYSLGISLVARTHLRPENGERDSRYFMQRGSNIVGGAWTTYGKDGNQISPTPESPSLVYSVTLPHEKFATSLAITPEDTRRVQEARDYISGLIAPK